MKVSTKITFKEYAKLIYTLTYKKPVMKLLLFLVLLVLIWIIGYYSRTLPVPKPSIYQYTTLVLILVIQPLVIFLTIRRNYLSSSHLTEQLQIEFTGDEIQMTGDSFYTVLNWKKIYKVQELKNWFLVYQNTLSAIIIPKRSFNKNDESRFKQILLSMPGLKLQLKGG
jgi:hypothetical protein